MDICNLMIITTRLLFKGLADARENDTIGEIYNLKPALIWASLAAAAGLAAILVALTGG